MTTHLSDDEEPLTIISSKVQRAVDQQELQHNRRVGDRIDAYVKAIVPVVLTAVIAGLVTLTAWLWGLRDAHNVQQIYIAQLQSTVSELILSVKELQGQRLKFQGEQLDKLMSLTTEVAVIDRRLSIIEKQIELLQAPDKRHAKIL